MDETEREAIEQLLNHSRMIARGLLRSTRDLGQTLAEAEKRLKKLAEPKEAERNERDRERDRSAA